MTTQDMHRFTSLYINMSLSRSLRYFVRGFKMKRGFVFLLWRSNNGTEFENAEFKSFYERNVFSHNFSSSREPQQNEIVERKNKTLQEMARTMLCENSLPKHLWTEAVNINCYVQNKIFIRLSLIKKDSI